MMTTSSANPTRHDRYVVMKPPSRGPTAAAIAAAAPTSAYAFFCAAPVKFPWISACIAGSSSDADAARALDGIDDPRQFSTIAKSSPHGIIRATALGHVHDVKALGSVARH